MAAGRTPGGILAEQPQARGGTVLLLVTPPGAWRDVAAGNELTATRERGLAHAVRQQAVVADPHEVSRQDMEHEAAGELGPRQPQDLRAVAVRTVAPTEGDLSAVVVEDAGVGESDLARVTRHVADDLLGAGQGRLRVDHPALAGRALKEMTPERRCDSKGVVIVGRLDLVEQLPPEDPAQHTVGDKEFRTARDPSLGIVG